MAAEPTIRLPLDAEPFGRSGMEDEIQRQEERNREMARHMDTEYPKARKPTESEWATRRTFLDSGRSVPKTAYALGLERAQVIRAVMVCRDFLSDSGWSAEYALARRTGFGEADSRLRADIVATHNTRRVRTE